MFKINEDLIIYEYGVEHSQCHKFSFHYRLNLGIQNELERERYFQERYFLHISKYSHGPSFQFLDICTYHLLVHRCPGYLRVKITFTLDNDK